MLEEREYWRTLQNFMIENFLKPIYHAWLEMFMLIPGHNLPANKFEKWKRVEFRPRGWTWVDPRREVSANIDALEAKIKSATEIAHEQGKDIHQVYEDLKFEKEILLKLKLEQENDEKIGGNRTRRDTRADRDEIDDDGNPDAVSESTN